MGLMSDKIMEMMLKEFNKLPPKAKNAFLWVIINKEVVKELCKGPKMSEEKIQAYSEIALEKEDYITFLMLQYKKEIDRQEEDN